MHKPKPVITPANSPLGKLIHERAEQIMATIQPLIGDISHPDTVSQWASAIHFVGGCLIGQIHEQMALSTDIDDIAASQALVNARQGMDNGRRVVREAEGSVH